MKSCAERKRCGDSSAGVVTLCLPSSVWNPGQHRQLHRPLSCRRCSPYSSGPISRRCPHRFQHRKPMQSCAQADRCCFLLITQARAYKALRPRASDRAVRVPPPAQFCGGRPPLNELPVDSHCRHRKPMQQSAKWTRRQASHPAQGGQFSSTSSVCQPSGRALHPELPRPSRRKPSHSLGKHPAGRASELQRSFQPEGRQHRKPMKLCARWRRLLMWPRTGRCFVGLHPSVTSCPGRPGM